MDDAGKHLLLMLAGGDFACSIEEQELYQKFTIRRPWEAKAQPTAWSKELPVVYANRPGPPRWKTWIAIMQAAVGERTRDSDRQENRSFLISSTDSVNTILIFEVNYGAAVVWSKTEGQ